MPITSETPWGLEGSIGVNTSQSASGRIPETVKTPSSVPGSSESAEFEHICTGDVLTTVLPSTMEFLNSQKILDSRGVLFKRENRQHKDG